MLIDQNKNAPHNQAAMRGKNYKEIAVNTRWLTAGAVVLFVGLAGCQFGGTTTSNSGANANRGGAGGKGPIEVSSRSIMTFTLCANGLPTNGMWKCDPTFGDFNKDGQMDLAALPRLGKGPRVWLGNGRCDWKESSGGLEPKATSCGGGIVSIDVNKDGMLDLVVADHCQGIYVYLGDGLGQWKMVTEKLCPNQGGAISNEGLLGAEDIDVADVNGDGHYDLVAGSQDEGGITVYFGNGTGENWVQQSESALPSKGWAMRTSFHDVNKDGFMDIVASYGEGPQVWHGDGKGGWSAASKGLPKPMVHGLFTGHALGDVNGDGRIDLAVANWVDGPEVFLQEADGSWKNAGEVFPQMLGGAVGIALADLDQDGKLDIVVSGRMTQEVGNVYGLFVLHAEGNARWTYLDNTRLPAGGLSTAWGLSTGDANGDGVVDITFGTGGIVATDKDSKQPVVDARLQVWCTHLADPAQAVLTSD